MLGTVRGDAVLPVWTGAFAARDLRRIGQLRRKAEAFGDFRGAEEIDLGVREPAPALGAVPDGVRADAEQSFDVWRDDDRRDLQGPLEGGTLFQGDKAKFED